MQVPSSQFAIPRFQADRTVGQNLKQIDEFATSLKDQFKQSAGDPGTELGLLRLSSQLKNETLAHTAEFNVRTAKFQGLQTGLKIAMAAATAGAIDAVVFAQTQDTPFSLSAVSDPSLDREDFDKMSRMRQTIDQCATNMVDFHRGQTGDPEFASKRVDRSLATLVESIDSGDAGPSGYFQLGYRLGALSGTTAAHA